MRSLIQTGRRGWRLTQVLALALVLVACRGSGGGRIVSNDGSSRATFDFKYEDTGEMSGKFDDPRGVIYPNPNDYSITAIADVNLKVSVKKVKFCDSSGSGNPCKSVPASKTKGGCVWGDAQYISQNKKLPGGGYLTLIACDADGSATDVDQDYILLTVYSGPFAGYINYGNPHGDIKIEN